MWNRQKQLSLRLIVKDNSSPDTPSHFSRGPFVWNLESQGQVHCQTSQSYSTCFLPDSHLFSKVPAPRKSFIPMSCWIKGQQWLFDSTKKKSPSFQETPHAISTDVNGASVATFVNAGFKVAWLNNAVPSQLPPGTAFRNSSSQKQELMESLTPRCIQTNGNKENRQMNRRWHRGVPSGFYKWLFRWLLVVAYVCGPSNESLWKQHKLNK